MSEIIKRPQASAAICRGWRPVVKGSLRGFADIETPSGLILCDVAIHESGGKRWAWPASIPQLDGDKRHIADPARPGKYLWKSAIKFRDEEVRKRFTEACIVAIEAAGISPWGMAA